MSRKRAAPIVIDVEAEAEPVAPVPERRAIAAPALVTPTGIVVTLPPDVARTLERYATIGGELADLGRKALDAFAAFAATLETARETVERDTRALRRRRGRRRTR